MTIDQYRKFIDATLLAAACEYLNQQALAKVQEDLQRIISQYNFTPNAPDTDKEFENFMLTQRKSMKEQTQPDTQTKFLVKRFYKIAI
jgi:hypothetical protein